MGISRRHLLHGLSAGAVLAAVNREFVKQSAAAAKGRTAPKREDPVRYVRFRLGERSAYGIADQDRVRELEGNLLDSPAETGKTHPLNAVELLWPCEPSKILALAGNYKSHLGTTPPSKNPEVFIKSPSALLAPGGTIVIPPEARNVHYEGEMVVVIGKKAKNVSPADAAACVFGVTCGNDVSERDWQKNDRQWWRAKASDTFAPLGPWIVRGIDYGDLLLTTRLNGEVKQQARTSELIFDVPAIVSFISKHMTLLPGDLIYTGTPGQTSAMKPGDMVEVEIERIGILRNRVA